MSTQNLIAELQWIEWALRELAQDKSRLTEDEIEWALRELAQDKSRLTEDEAAALLHFRELLFDIIPEGLSDAGFSN